MVAVPRELIEAARLEDASNWTIFRKIIVPMTSPTALYVFTITIIFGLQYMLVPVNMLTQGGPDQGSSNYCLYRLPIRPGVFPDRQIRSLCHAVYGSVFDFPGAEDPVPGQTCPLRKLKGGCHEKTICGYKPLWNLLLLLPYLLTLYPCCSCLPRPLKA